MQVNSAAIIAVAIGGWLVIWISVCWLIGLPWRRLAQQFPASDDFDGEALRFRTGKFNWVSYGSCLTLTAGYRYLHLSVFFPFRVGHPRVSIPWAEIRATVPSGRRRSWVELGFQNLREVNLFLPARTAEDLVQMSSGRLRIERPDNNGSNN